MTHADKGVFTLAELSPAFERGPRLLFGRGSSQAEAQLSGPAHLRVQAEGNWEIEFIRG
jgi:hypothetical protein